MSQEKNEEKNEKYNEEYKKEIELLRNDFLRFSRLHSWYKHLPLEGIPYYFYKGKGQQIRHPIDPQVDDYEGEHYRFVMAYEPPNCKKYFTVRFGPFLRGDGYGIDLIERGRGGHIDENVKKWLQKEYPVLYKKREEIETLLYSDENLSKPYENLRELYRERSKIDEEIFSTERERYWKEIVNVFRV